MELAVTIAILISAFVLFRHLLSCQQRRGAPGPKGFPLVGSALQINPSKVHHQFYDFACKYGCMFKIRMFGTEILALNSIETINDAFQKNGHIFKNRTTFFITNYLNTHHSIAFSGADDVHNYARKTFVKGIHAYGTDIPQFESTISGEIGRVVKQLEDFDEAEFEVTKLLNRSLINIMSILVLANFWFIHHDEKIWGDPWTFRPERFLDENGQLLPNGHQFMKNWVPFGWGQRRCLGTGIATTRIFLYMTSLFQRWTFEPVPGKCGSCDPRGSPFVFDLLFKPKPFYCKAKRRQ